MKDLVRPLWFPITIDSSTHAEAMFEIRARTSRRSPAARCGLSTGAAVDLARRLRSGDGANAFVATFVPDFAIRPH